MSVAAEAFHRAGLYSAAQVRELDRRAIEQLPIAGYQLMQRAAQASWDCLRRHWPQARRIAVLCGPGNNGGDGYEIARLARAAGLQVSLACVGGPPRVGDAVQAHAAWVAEQGEAANFDAHFAQSALAQADVICDAIFGIGITRPVEGLAAEAIRAVNQRRADQAVLAVDVPSGLDADTGAEHGAAVRADVSISFIGRKLGLYLGRGPDLAGAREFADLGVPARLASDLQPPAELLSNGERLARLPRRARTAHKGSNGHVLLVGGDSGMAGAILLAARAALRSGAGLVSVATRPQHALALTGAQPEVMFHGLDHAAELDELIRRADAIAVGPGLGQGLWSSALLDRCLRATCPLLLDADALNLVARRPGLRLPANTVITPHPGEAARLLGTDTAAVQRDRLAAVRALRDRYGVVAVLKGAGSLIAGERIALCPYGNPGMGVGGSGDVLSGVIAALLGQGLEVEAASATGVLVHALAGDAAAVAGERGLLPSDLIEQLRSMVNP